MLKKSCIALLLFFCSHLYGQENRLFSGSAITLQYAGSTGFISLGFSKSLFRDKLEAGVLYGYVPRALGGRINTFTFKLSYNPFRIDLSDKIRIEPLQAGAFVSRSFSEHLGSGWGNKYPKGYYWWSKSMRYHAFIGTQISYIIDRKYVDRLSFYFEANTNDLYLASYLPNRKALSIYDILFFGAGIKLYLK